MNFVWIKWGKKWLNTMVLYWLELFFYSFCFLMFRSEILLFLNEKKRDRRLKDEARKNSIIIPDLYYFYIVYYIVLFYMLQVVKSTKQNHVEVFFLKIFNKQHWILIHYFIFRLMNFIKRHSKFALDSVKCKIAGVGHS